MIYFVFDNPKDRPLMEFLENDSKITTIYPKVKLEKISQFFKYCSFISKMVKKGDFVIFWYDFIGIIFSLFYSSRKTNVLILNILLKNKKTLKNKIATILYKHVLKKKNVNYTVTSKEYGLDFKKRLNIKKDFYLLHDPFHNNSIDAKIMNKGYCFCGGNNSRDWELMITLAKNLPNRTFHFVMSRNDFENFKNKISNNVILKTCIPYNEFLKEISESSFIALPLLTEAPAGLLTFFIAAQYHKMIITNSTLTTREYLDHGRGVLCNNLSDWIKNTDYYFGNQSEADKIADNFFEFLDENCSENRYINTIFNIVEEISNEKA